MQIMKSDSNTRKFGIITMKSIAVASIVLYIVLSTVFEESKTGLSRYASVGILICLGACGLYVLMHKRIKLESYIIILLAFGIFLAISTLYSPASSSLKSTYLYRCFSSLILLFLISNVVQSEKDIQWLIHGYIFAGIVLALYLYMFYGIQNLSSLTSRLSNELANQNSIGISCACAFVFSIVELVIRSRKNRLLYIASMIITLPACLFSGSRKSIILIVISIFVFFLLSAEKRQTIKRLLLSGIVIAGVIVIIQNVPAFAIINERFEQFFSLFGHGNAIQDTGNMNRIMFLERGLDAFKSSPLWGNGFVFSYYLFGTYSHNNYVELLMNNGLIGFVLYYWVHLRLLIAGLLMRKKTKKLSAMILVVMTIILFIDIGSVNYYSRYTLIMICLASKLSNIFEGYSKYSVMEEV